MKIELEKSFTKKLAKRIERYSFEVGILDDKPHYEPVQVSFFQAPQLKTFAGGDARKQSRVKSALSIGEILVANMRRTGRNFLLEPFEKQSSALLKFTQSFLKMAISGRGSVKRVENLLQANVRNPILKGEYGRNRRVTSNIKGFDRHLIDTAQMFKAIRAKVKRRV